MLIILDINWLLANQKWEWSGVYSILSLDLGLVGCHAKVLLSQPVLGTVEDKE